LQKLDRLKTRLAGGAVGPENRAVSLETRIRLVLECLTRALLLLLTRAGGSEPGKEGEEGYAELEVRGLGFGDRILLVNTCSSEVRVG
jgi:hypothetical protein